LQSQSYWKSPLLFSVLSFSSHFYSSFASLLPVSLSSPSVSESMTSSLFLHWTRQSRFAPVALRAIVDDPLRCPSPAKNSTNQSNNISCELLIMARQAIFSESKLSFSFSKSPKTQQLLITVFCKSPCVALCNLYKQEYISLRG
jgi:hypothetical protein